MVNNSSTINMHDHDYDNNLNVGSERLVTKNLPAGTYRKAKISSVDVIKLNSKKNYYTVSKKTQRGKRGQCHQDLLIYCSRLSMI